MGETYITAEVEFKTRTLNAILIAYDGGEYWIPRSLLSYSCDKLVNELERGDPFDLQVLEWKAMEIGLDW